MRFLYTFSYTFYFLKWLFPFYFSLGVTKPEKEVSHHGKDSSSTRHVECLTTLRTWTPG